MKTGIKILFGVLLVIGLVGITIASPPPQVFGFDRIINFSDGYAYFDKVVIGDPTASLDLNDSINIVGKTTLSGDLNVTGNVNFINLTVDEITYINETKYNLTIQNIAEINEFEEFINFSVSGGIGGNFSITRIDFLITQITVTPSNLSTSYRFNASELSTLNLIDKDRIVHIGEWDIIKNHALDDEIVMVNVTSASQDDDFTIKITYLNNFIP